MVSPVEMKKKIATDIVALVGRNQEVEISVISAVLAIETGYRSSTIRAIIDDLIQAGRLRTDHVKLWIQKQKGGA